MTESGSGWVKWLPVWDLWDSVRFNEMVSGLRSLIFPGFGSFCGFWCFGELFARFFEGAAGVASLTEEAVFEDMEEVVFAG